MEYWGHLGSVIAAIAALGTAFVGLYLSVQLRAREVRQAASDCHRELTTGEVAEARKRLGDYLYSSRRLSKEGKLEFIAAYYSLLWAVERVANIQATSKGRMDAHAAKFLAWNLKEIANNIAIVHYEYGERLGIDDAQAWGEFEKRLRMLDESIHAEVIRPCGRGGANLA